MLKRIFTCIALLSCFAVQVQAQDQSYAAHVQQYIKQYKSLAIAEQKRSGVPAAVTLGQGILETQAGTSELVTGANNHFGIKCKKDWRGETFAHTDDAPNECFRKYPKAEDSYRDHSDYLKTSARYAALFKLSQTDYAGWAVGLKRCGYATNPRYAQQLIKIIEDFKLQDYTYAALDNDADYTPGGTALSKPGTRTSKPIMDDDDPVLVKANLQKATSPAAAAAIAATPPAPAAAAKPPVAGYAKQNDVPRQPDRTIKAQEPPAVDERAEAGQIQATGRTLDNAKPVTVNGLKAVYAFKGELPFQYAIKFNMRYEHLLDINDLPDAPLSANMFIYLEKKNATGPRPYHVVKPGETLLQVAQLEGMQLRRLMTLNHIDAGEEPAEGTQLYMQDNAPRKPQVYAASKPGGQDGRFMADMDKPGTADYVNKNTIKAGNPALNKTIPEKPAAAPYTATGTKLLTRSAANATKPAEVQPMNSEPVVAKPAAVAPKPVAAVTAPEIKPALHPAPAVATVPKAVVSPVNTAPVITKPAEQPLLSRKPTEKTATPEDTKVPTPVAVTPPPVSKPVAQPVAETPKMETPVEEDTKMMADNHAEESKPAVIEKPVEVRPVSIAKPAEAAPVSAAAPTPAEPVGPEEPMDDLARLKARLDKVVYVNDKKVDAANRNTNAGSGNSMANSTAANKYYIVRDGDTAFSIAKDNNITMKQLMDWNEMDFDQIKTGQKLRVKE